MQNFEIIDKDVMGRICRIYTNHGKLETPAILPVVNPNIPLVDPVEIVKIGAKGIITNAYIILKTMRDQAVEKGVHRVLGIDVPVMTDSGSYQLMVYGDIEVSNSEIIEFQNLIGSDIIVPLDVPTPPDAERSTAESDLRMTIEREREAAKKRKNSLLALPIQGSTYIDLRKLSAREARKIGGDIYPIGALVPLLDSYRFAELCKIILEVREVIKVEPIHLFGCGHPMLFAFAVALGCDLFDSAAYALYAKDDRYLTPFGTKKLSEMNYFPCRCPVCKKYEPQELREMNKSEREEILAKHNLFISFQEIDAVKQAIKENTLFELVESRIRSHPNLLAGWRKIREYGDLVEKYDPKIKRKFLYCGIESIYRPAVKRHIRSLVNVEFEGAEILVSSDFGMYADIYLRPVFGPVLYQMNEVYPAGHAEVPEICEIEEEAIKLAVKNLYALMRKFHDKKFKIYVSKEWAKYMKDIPENGELHVLS